MASRLAWLSDDRAIHNPDRPTDSFFEPLRNVFPKHFDTQQTQPLRAVAQALEQGNIRNVGPVRRVSYRRVASDAQRHDVVSAIVLGVYRGPWSFFGINEFCCRI